MKRLLLTLIAALALPTAVEANPFSGDIVKKNDLGEKYIVKKSTVYKSSLSNKVIETIKKIGETKGNIKYYKDYYGTKIELATYNRDGYIRDNRSKRWINYMQSQIDQNNAELKEKLDRYNQELIKYEELKKEQMAYLKENEDNLILLSFTPIFVDLNGTKMPQESKKVACISPFVDQEKKNELAERSGENLIQSNGIDLFSKVCKQHAKFKK